MRKFLAARRGGGEFTKTELERLRTLKNVVTSYLTSSLMPSSHQMKARDERELRTLAEAIDALLLGDLGRVGDLLMQRFRCVEMVHLDGNYHLAQHLELIPPHRVTATPAGMRAELIKRQLEVKRLEKGEDEARRGRKGE